MILMTCPSCGEYLRGDLTINDGGLAEICVSCPNDRDRTDTCIPDVIGYLKLVKEHGDWRLKGVQKKNSGNV